MQLLRLVMYSGRIRNVAKNVNKKTFAIHRFDTCENETYMPILGRLRANLSLGTRTRLCRMFFLLKLSLQFVPTTFTLSHLNSYYNLLFNASILALVVVSSQYKIVTVINIT